MKFSEWLIENENENEFWKEFQLALQGSDHKIIPGRRGSSTYMDFGTSWKKTFPKVKLPNKPNLKLVSYGPPHTVSLMWFIDGNNAVETSFEVSSIEDLIKKLGDNKTYKTSTKVENPYKW